MASIGVGTLALREGCLVLDSADSDPAVLVFPYGQGEWDAAARSLSFGGRTYPLGSPLEVNGGVVERSTYPIEGAHSIPACGGLERLFLVG